MTTQTYWLSVAARTSLLLALLALSACAGYRPHAYEDSVSVCHGSGPQLACRPHDAEDLADQLQRQQELLEYRDEE